MAKNVILILVTLLGTTIFLLLPGPFWVIGTVLVLLPWIAYLIFVIPAKPAETRGLWAFAACFVIIASVTGFIAMLYLQKNPLSIEVNTQSLSSIPVIEVEDFSISVNPNITSFFIGTVVALVTTPILLVVVGYFSSIYVLALHEDLTPRDAFKSFMLLIFNVQRHWLLIKDGEIIPLKEKGFARDWLSLGKVIVTPGNAVVMEKGGKITGIYGPGVFLTGKERIRQIFDLRLQFDIQELDNVITADRIPLKITLGVGYKITPAPNPNALSVLKEKNYGLFPVAKETLCKAAFNATAGGWTGFAKGAPASQLRDQIMAHRFNELFEIHTEKQDISIRVNERQIKHIETAILDTVNGFADTAMGVTITGVDIVEITLPDDVTAAVNMGIRSRAEAEAIQTIEETRNFARGEMVANILASISSQTNQPIGDMELRLATVFANISRRALTDDVLGHEYVKVLEKLAAGDGMKIFNASPNQSALGPEHINLQITPDAPNNGR